ncbi:hypothetical protein ACYSNU_09195 [Enterococcus sp. LJL120]
MESKSKKTSIKWVQLFFSALWFIGAGLVMVLDLTNNLPYSFQVPRFIGWLYDLVGVLPASIIQLVLCGLLFFEALPKRKKIGE